MLPNPGRLIVYKNAESFVLFLAQKKLFNISMIDLPQKKNTAQYCLIM